MVRSSPLTRLIPIAALALVAWGCGATEPLAVDEGRVRFVLSADPAPVVSPDIQTSGAEHEREHGYRLLQSANVTFASIVARNLDGVLVDVAMELPVTVDVLLMEEGRKIVLPDGELPPATYDQLVVVMTQVEVVLHDGTTLTVTPPGGGWTAIVPICPFTVEEGATTVVGLGFDLWRAFKWREGRFLFAPHLHCTDDSAPDGS